MNNEMEIYCICCKSKCNVEVNEGNEIVYCNSCEKYLEYDEYLEFTIKYK